MQYLTAWTQKIYLPSPQTRHATEWYPLKDSSLLKSLVLVNGWGFKELHYHSFLGLIIERIQQEDSSFQFGCSVMSDSLQPHGLQHTRPPCPSTTSRVYSNSCPLSLWCPPISSSVSPFSSCPQSFPASGSFPMSQLFTSGGQSSGASASVLPTNIQVWLTGLISMLSKGLSRAFSSTTVQKHRFFSGQPSLWSHICVWYWKNHSFD